MKFPLVIQARMGSSRLPGKMALPFYGEKTVLEVLIERLQSNLDQPRIIVATTRNPSDQTIVEMCKQVGVEFLCGDEENVLSRFTTAAEECQSEALIRICADNPFIIPEYISDLTEFAQQNPASQYVSFGDINRKPSILGHTGLFTEYVTAKSLQKIVASTDSKRHFEHATLYILENPERFQTELIPIPHSIQQFPDLRLTLDTKHDYDVCAELFELVSSQHTLNFSIGHLIQILEANPCFLTQMKSNILRNPK